MIICRPGRRQTDWASNYGVTIFHLKRERGELIRQFLLLQQHNPKKSFNVKQLCRLFCSRFSLYLNSPPTKKEKEEEKEEERKRLVAFKRRCGRSGDGGLPSFNFFKKEFLREGEKRKKRPKGRERAIKQMAASTEILVRSFVQLFLVFWFFHVWFVFHANDWGTLIIMYTYLYTHVVF